MLFPVGQGKKGRRRSRRRRKRRRRGKREKENREKRGKKKGETTFFEHLFFHMHLPKSQSTSSSNKVVTAGAGDKVHLREDFFLNAGGFRSLCFTDQPRAPASKTLEMRWGSCRRCSEGLSQLGAGQGSWTTSSRLLNGKLGWIFFPGIHAW